MALSGWPCSISVLRRWRASSASILAATATLVMAMRGFGYWTLALGPLIGVSVYVLLVMTQNPIGFSLPRLATIREPFTFSSHMLVSRFAWYGFSNADFAVISKA